MKNAKVKPTHANILIHVLVPEKIGDIHLPEQSRKEGQKGTLRGIISDIGPEVTCLVTGSYVLFHKHHFTSYDAQKFKDDDAHYLIMKEADILAILA